MARSRKDTHQWSESDNILALYYHKYKTEYLGLDEIQLAAMIGTTVASLKIQASNFRRLHTETIANRLAILNYPHRSLRRITN